jgi:hypothetical protein
MKEHVPQATASLECPALKKNCEVNFELNVFRGANHGGLEVTGCSEFLHKNNAVICGKDCIHTQEAEQLHKKAIGNHQEELSKIGSDVIG